MSERRPNGLLGNLPLPALFLVMAALWVVFQLVFAIGAVTPVKLVTTAAGGLLFSAVLTGAVGLTRRRLGGTRQAASFATALKTGRVPPDADVVRWRQELDRADRTRFRRTAWPVAVSLLPIALGVAGLFDPAARPVAILLIVLFVGLDVATLLAVPARRRRVERLRAALDPHG